MRCLRPLTLASAVTLAAFSLLAAGCGGGGGSPSNGVANLGSTTTTSLSSAAQNAAAEAVRYATCMRSNGVTNFPDPSSNGRPQSLNQIDPNSATFQTAYTACRKYAANGQGGPPSPSTAQLRLALAFAQCMRKHRFPQFPDPLTTTPEGPNLALGTGEYFPFNSTTDFQSPSPAFRQAAKACGVQLP